MSQDILEKVRRLIALAGSSNMNEARNAAYRAAKLIRMHNLGLTSSQGLTHTRTNSDLGGDLNDVPWDARRWGRCPVCGFMSGLIMVTGEGYLCMACARAKHVWETTYANSKS